MQHHGNSRTTCNADINASNRKGGIIMNAKKWMKVGLVATLGLGWTFAPTLSVHASELRSGAIGSGCSGSCMDVWQVQCKDVATHTVRAWVKDPVAAIVNIIVTNMGYAGPAALVGQADPEIGAGSYSSASDVVRPGTTHGPTKT